MRQTVLLVEDEFLIAMDLKLLLEQRGWRVTGPAATVEEALGLLHDELLAVAVLDVTLRDGAVTRLAEALRAQNVPFVIASAHHNPERQGGEVLAGARNVGKPTEVQDLLAALEEATRSGGSIPSARKA